MSLQLQGVGVALITPFNEDYSIDYTALEILINKVIDGGVDYLVALGTTAETPTLAAHEKEAILAFIIEKTAQRKPIIVGVGGNNTASVVDDIHKFSAYSIDGFLSVAPYYNKPSQEGIYQHYKQLAAATTLPIILYNVPGRTVTNIAPTTVARLANDFNNIVAIKEASGNLVQCMQVVQLVPSSFTVLSGDDNLVLPQISIGMKGVISVAANAFPKTFSTMVHAALRNDYATARDLHYQQLYSIDLLFAEGNPTGVKYLLSKAGIIKNNLRLPLIPASSNLMEAFEKEPSFL